MSFNNLQLIEPVLKALSKEGYNTPTPIQQQSIPAILQQRDLLGCAQTGTGKTAAFTIPILQLMYQQQQQGPQRQRRIQTLILTPTRELAIQIGESIEAYGRFLPLKHKVIFGGVPQYSQVQAIRSGVDIIVATPGRLLDLMQQGIISLSNIQFFVLDEADRMLDMGFVHDVKRIIAKLPAKRQTLFFSATMPNEIMQLANILLTNPVKVEVTPPSSTVDMIQQSLYLVEKQHKQSLLVKLLKDETIETLLVFTQMKHAADKLARSLNAAGIRTEAIHGNKSQNARQSALLNFKTRKTRVLVATDIAARGIDIDELTHVLNYELPNIPETYVHRIGRTGRAGASGVAISFCDYSERSFLSDIQKLIKKTIPVVKGHEFENNSAQPVQVPVVQQSNFNRNFRGNSNRGNGNRNNGNASRGNSSRERRPERTHSQRAY
ncbi:MAG: DEAD/DEAH box helicase [Chitinophagaceae bacterium]|nr:DEAD/DEAH box helicase [Chitinophagaceae bacterium]